MRQCLLITLNYKQFSLRCPSISLIRSEVLMFYGVYLIDMDNFGGITVPLKSDTPSGDHLKVTILSGTYHTTVIITRVFLNI